MHQDVEDLFNDRVSIANAILTLIKEYGWNRRREDAIPWQRMLDWFTEESFEVAWGRLCSADIAFSSGDAEIDAHIVSSINGILEKYVSAVRLVTFYKFRFVGVQELDKMHEVPLGSFDEDWATA
jgi:hypothetical protein